MAKSSSEPPWTAKIITLFPELFPGPLGCSIAGRALQENRWALETVDLRQFGIGKHRTVDDRPVGGGPGMVFKADVVASSLESTTESIPVESEKWPTVCLSPRGVPLRQQMIEGWSNARGMTLLCGRFEGIDERVIKHFELLEVSIGDFVLSGGEIAAYALIDAIVRLIPSVVGNQRSIEEESYTTDLLEYPQYTKPTIWRGMRVPDVLYSGNHAAIAKWRKMEAMSATRERRPDLWAAYQSRSLAADGPSASG